MARIARIVVPDYPHHVIQRGNRRQNVFFSDEDKQRYIDLLCEYAIQAGVEFWSYCLMDNHVHLIAVPGVKEALARGIGETHKRYTRMINNREGWRGYLWQGRFLSYPLDERHLWAAMRYVEQNPLRAGLVERAEDYPWSSARAHVYKTADKLLARSAVLSVMKDWSSFLAVEETERELKQLRKHALTGRPLGDESFILELEEITGRVLRRQKPGPRKIIK